MKKLSRSDMQSVKGGTQSPGSFIWSCLDTLVKRGRIVYECSATDPSMPNYYCTKTEKTC